MPSLSVPSAPLAFCSLVLALFSLSDFISVSSLSGVDAHERGLSASYWSSQSLIRLCFFFSLTGYVYLNRPPSGSDFMEGVEDLVDELARGKTGGIQLIQNSFVFSWAFAEMVVWFWVRKPCSCVLALLTSTRSS